MEIAIIGSGSWGLAVLDRILAHAAARSADGVVIHVIDKDPPGPGIHKPDLPDYLLLNTAAGQLCLFGARALDQGGNAIDHPTFAEWLVRQGASSSEPGLEHTFRPRRELGTYLGWVFETLKDRTPPGVTLQVWREEVVDLTRASDRRERLHFVDGRSILVDHVVLTTGHTSDKPERHWPGENVATREGHSLAADPVEILVDTVRPGERIGVAGSGLTAIDIVTALTTGRGGGFSSGRDSDLIYRPSGEEPVLYLFSRSGLPFCCRPATSLNLSGAYTARFCTDEALAEARARSRRQGRQGLLDFRVDVLPLLFAEMSEVYAQRAALVGRREGFDPADHLFLPAFRRAPDAEAYRKLWLATLRRDLAESERGEAESPVKAASEMFRVLRDFIRLAVDHGGLTPESRRDFRTSIAGQINRVIVGPPLARGREMAALIAAGIVRLDLGANPDLRYVLSDRVWVARTTAFPVAPVTMSLDRVVRGYVTPPGILRSESRLLRSLTANGRLRPFPGGGPDCDAPDITQDGHPVTIDGIEQRSLTVLGVLGEGVSYFNQYVPSPRSRAKAFRQADRLAGRLFRATKRAFPVRAFDREPSA